MHKVTPDTVAKVRLYAHEAITEALNPSMLRTMTTIPVPELHRLWRSVPGTLNGVACTGPLFTDYGAGPSASYDEMTDWLNHKLDVSQRTKRAPLDAPRFDNSWPLVFTHQHLCPRNIMLGRDVKVYMVDWEGSGFYPSWFEYVDMRSDEHFKSRL
ncbi:hypothetical protein DFH29DRAFT_996449 [Suillus ampliporus]|nr:hypothetical protein DFH29DRAFT_996449 [Suillus ampliporus]